MTALSQRLSPAGLDVPRPRDPRRDGPTSPVVVPRRSGGGFRDRSMRTVLVVAAGVIATWLVFVFGSAVARSDAIEREAAVVRAENAALVERIEAGRREVELIQTERFLSIQARAFGMGEPGEHPFALSPDAPQRVEIVPLGEDPAPPAPPTPLEEWLQLLFG